MWFIHTMAFYSAIKNNKTGSFVAKWMELENIMLSEISQFKKVKGHMFFSYMESRAKIGSKSYFSQMSKENSKIVEGFWGREVGSGNEN